jgi:hypothetical protein
VRRSATRQYLRNRWLTEHLSQNVPFYSQTYGFTTSSYFSPYVTTVGLYNNNYELLAVAKLSQPLPLSQVTDTTILVNLDL